MSSKFFFLFFFIFASCGVKGPPIPPKESSLPSYVDQFLERPEALPSLKADEDEGEEKKATGESNPTP